jgi:NADPH:quinone reductase-like Zn-dependent oxidoreductase
VVIIGILAGAAAPVSIPTVFSKNLRVLGISVGSRAQFEQMSADFARWRLKPVIDRAFGFDDVPAALRLMEAGGHFGKIVVDF